MIRLYSINFFNNPKREIKKIKEYLDKLTSAQKASANAFKKTYRFAKLEERTLDSAAILSGQCDGELTKIIRAIVTAEEPISTQFLIRRALSVCGITKYGSKLENKLSALISACAFKSASFAGFTYCYKSEKSLSYDRYRVENGTQVRTSDSDYTPFEVISLVKAILLDKVSMYSDELIPAVIKQLGVPRTSDRMTAFINACIDAGVNEGLFIRSISDRISLS